MEKDLHEEDYTCPGVSSCAERFSDSLRGAIITFHDSKHSLDAVERRSVRRNEKQLYFPIESAKARTQGRLVKCYVV
jgi:hypothetical protein